MYFLKVFETGGGRQGVRRLGFLRGLSPWLADVCFLTIFLWPSSNVCPQWEEREWCSNEEDSDSKSASQETSYSLLTVLKHLGCQNLPEYSSVNQSQPQANPQGT